MNTNKSIQQDKKRVEANASKEREADVQTNSFLDKNDLELRRALCQ
ncbi:hypothetical protein AN395_00251 [Pseudoalteromonas sp. P1-30]|nr:hypothetical protein AN395_00251 [Pseudoalteromonas sp. P1-30]